MKKYSKVINGETVIKAANEIEIKCSGFTFISPDETNILNDGWVLHSQDEEDIELEINNKRKEIIKLILDYDSSSKVNVFYKNGTPMWLDKTTRASLKIRFELELKQGNTDTILWYNGIPYKMKIEEALNLLELIELYAICSYDVTQQHINKINKITTIKELENYDYTLGYPLVLNL